MKRTLQLLTRRGLVDRLSGKRARYVAVSPDIAIEPLVTRHEDELRKARGAVKELNDAFHQAARRSHPTELVEIITGAEPMTTRFERLQQATQRQVRIFDRPPYVQDPHTDDISEQNPEELALLDTGIEYRAIYSTAAITIPGRLDNHIRRYCERGEKARVRPELPLKLVVFDERCAMIPIKTTPHRLNACFLVHPSDLLDALIALFEGEWQRATPLSIHSTDGSGTERDQALDQVPDAPTARLLSYLAAGLTDEAIARSLGCSLRTAQRHTQRLMLDLNATSRFQAGMKARERGWI